MTPKLTRVDARAHLSPADSALPSRCEAVGHWVGRRGWRGRVARARIDPAAKEDSAGGHPRRPPNPRAAPGRRHLPEAGDCRRSGAAAACRRWRGRRRRASAPCTSCAESLGRRAACAEAAPRGGCSHLALAPRHALCSGHSPLTQRYVSARESRDSSPPPQPPPCFRVVAGRDPPAPPRLRSARQTSFCPLQTALSD